MPKKRSYLFIAFFPYIILTIYCLFGYLFAEVIEPIVGSSKGSGGDIAGLLLAGTPIIFYIIALITSLKIMGISLANQCDSQVLFRNNMIIKICHIPYYIFNVIAALALILFLGPILAFLFDCAVMLTSGLVGLAALLRARKEEKLSTSLMLIFAVSQFLFCIDVPIAILMYFLYRNKPENEIQDALLEFQQ